MFNLKGYTRLLVNFSFVFVILLKCLKIYILPIKIQSWGYLIILRVIFCFKDKEVLELSFRISVGITCWPQNAENVIKKEREKTTYRIMLIPPWCAPGSRELTLPGLEGLKRWQHVDNFLIRFHLLLFPSIEMDQGQQVILALAITDRTSFQLMWNSSPSVKPAWETQSCKCPSAH